MVNNGLASGQQALNRKWLDSFSQTSSSILFSGKAMNFFFSLAAEEQNQM
jgi:hypothetical protein